MENWYAVQVRAGREEVVLQLSKKIIDESALKEYFIPYYERMKRFQGEQHKEQYTLFPGYISFATEQVDVPFWELEKVQGLTKILGDGVEFILIREEGKVFLQKTGDSSHLAEMSKGITGGDRVIMMSGPLSKFKGKITSIDRHERLAVIQIKIFGRWMGAGVGLEIVHREQLKTPYQSRTGGEAK